MSLFSIQKPIATITTEHFSREGDRKTRQKINEAQNQHLMVILRTFLLAAIISVRRDFPSLSHTHTPSLSSAIIVYYSYN